MKRISLAVLLALFGLTAMAQDNNISLEGSGNIITKAFNVKPFDAIQAKGIYELVLVQGGNEGVKVEADDNLMHLFEVTNDGSTLVIDMPMLRGNHHNVNINDHGHKQLKLKVYVTLKSIKSLDAGVIGSVRSEGPLKLDNFEIDSKNVGNINLELTSTKLTVYNKGVGNMTLSGSVTTAKVVNGGVGHFNGEALLVQTMNIENTGVGNASVNVAKDISIKESFLGKVKNTGSAKTHKMDGVEI